MAGALEAVNGTDAMVTQAIEYNVGYARRNLDTAFTAAEWQTAWEGCVDPAADRNAGGFNFVPLAPPVSWGWTVSDPNNWCISIDASEFLFRVRLPQQIVPTTFGRILGVNELRTSASAVAKISVGGGGILPFGLSGGDGGGGLVCLSSNPPGLAEDPCTVIEGNFGTVRPPQVRKLADSDKRVLCLQPEFDASGEHRTRRRSHRIPRSRWRRRQPRSSTSATSQMSTRSKPTQDSRTMWFTRAW